MTLLVQVMILPTQVMPISYKPRTKRVYGLFPLSYFIGLNRSKKARSTSKNYPFSLRHSWFALSIIFPQGLPTAACWLQFFWFAEREPKKLQPASSNNPAYFFDNPKHKKNPTRTSRMGVLWSCFLRADCWC
jgi:hypothetical protein